MGLSVKRKVFFIGKFYLILALKNGKGMSFISGRYEGRVSKDMDVAEFGIGNFSFLQNWCL